MRAIWKGHIRFSLVSIPVRIYNAIDTAQTIRFNQISKETNSPIRYEKRCKKTDKIVTAEDIVKGYQYEPDQFVILENEDFEKVKLKSTKIIEIEGFVDQKEIHPSLFDAPYFAGPDGEVAAKAYSLLTATLKKSGKMGIGKVVLRDRESIMLMAPQGKGILLYKLRYPDEVRSINNIPDLDLVQEPDENELKLAATLVESMSKKMETLELRDKYNDALREIIEAKIEGKEIITIEEEEKPVIDIMTALKESIEQAKDSKKPMQKATGKKAISKTSTKVIKEKKKKTA